MKRTSRYLKLLQRVPFAESGYKERYFENSKFLQRNRITPWSCIPTALIGNAETMMGAPITAQEYRWLSVLFLSPHRRPYLSRFMLCDTDELRWHHGFDPSLETGTDFLY